MVNLFKLKPIFILSPGRSGTTILKAIIDSSPNVLVSRSESPLIGSLIISLSKMKSNYNKHKNYYKNAYKIGPFNFIPILEILLSIYTFGILYPYQILYFRKMFVKNIFNLNNIFSRIFGRKKIFFCTQLVIDNEEDTEEIINSIKKLYDNCYFISIIRNPINILESRTAFDGFKHMNIDRNI